MVWIAASARRSWLISTATANPSMNSMAMVTTKKETVTRTAGQNAGLR